MNKIFLTLIVCMAFIGSSQAMTVLNPKTDTVIHLGGDRSTNISFYADRTIDFYTLALRALTLPHHQCRTVFLVHCLLISQWTS